MSGLPSYANTVRPLCPSDITHAALAAALAIYFPLWEWSPTPTGDTTAVVYGRHCQDRTGDVAVDANKADGLEGPLLTIWANSGTEVIHQGRAIGWDLDTLAETISRRMSR